MTQNQTDVPEIPGLKALNRLLAMALWHPKQDSAGNAYSAIKTATKAVVKSGIIEAQFEVWKRGSVSAIKEFFPQFVELGCKFQYVLKSDPVDWAVERTWESLRGQGGVNKLGELGNHELDNVRWWLAIATQLKLEVNQKDAKSWRVPRWLTQSRSLAAQSDYFRSF